MDERSPRQPDSSRPPEDTDDTPAPPGRPGNPYRIPQRPAPAEGPTGFEYPRADTPPPAAPPSPPHPVHGGRDDAGTAAHGWGSGIPEGGTPGWHPGEEPSARPDAPGPAVGTPPHGWHPGVPDEDAAAFGGSPGPGIPHDGAAAHGWQTSPADGTPVPYHPGLSDTPAPGWHPGGSDEGETTRTWSAVPADGGGQGVPAYQGGVAGPGPDAPPPATGPQPPAAAPERPADDFDFLYGGGPPGPREPGEPLAPGQAPPGRRRSRRGLLIGVIAGIAALALVGGGVSWFVLTRPQPEEALDAYAAAWEERDYAGLAAVTTGGDPAAVLGGIDAGLGLEEVRVEIGAATVDGSAGSAPYEVTVSMQGSGDWGWEGELPLVRQDGAWLVDFSPGVAYPGLGEGQVLARTAVWGERGSILAADGTPMEGPDVSGTLAMIAGSLGEATEEDVERLGPAYGVGDTIGVSGLQRTYEERLAGEAATTILMVGAEQAEDPASLEATEENTVATLDGADGQDVVTSFDMAVQNAAADAVIGSDDPVGMVAVRASTGEILAAANVPGGFNRAFEGQYPPGSSLKIISYVSLLDQGLAADSTVECPKEYDPGGWPFVNAGGGEYGTQTVTEAFATSCNTALVAEVTQRLSPQSLTATAEQFGMNAPLDIGVPAFEPSFPSPEGSVMLGAQSIGQGHVLTSPLHMATVPAAIADGSWRHPVLVTEPAPEGLPEPTALPNAAALRPMMRAVVTGGTAQEAGFQGEVYGKTGSAEFGTPEGEDDELPTHAWMVGYKGDIAFAIVVEGGGGGGSVAGPLAAAFTNAL
ncbi:penicillin-binding transpeptidase domain-containing protein [Nocardiopsis sp. LOL_012]|uniref:penicillin-binding transpeptidase domain-containing protein n=1 Tax=Nocardiopsis sp. LOL_012 TaxID=3345409 RepID=UPI003A88A970